MSPDAQLPTLICIIGAPAVGKMTVGQEVCRRTGFKLFHGHIVADALTPFFAHDTPSLRRTSDAWNRMMFEEAAHAGLNLVTTMAWRFDVPADGETIGKWLQPYLEVGRVHCVELVAPVQVRMERNRTEQRRRLKNAYWVTDDYLKEGQKTHRYDSGGAFPFDVPHLRLENEMLPADAAAQRIIEHFGLPQQADPGGTP